MCISLVAPMLLPLLILLLSIHKRKHKLAITCAQSCGFQFSSVDSFVVHVAELSVFNFLLPMSIVHKPAWIYMCYLLCPRFALVGISMIMVVMLHFASIYRWGTCYWQDVCSVDLSSWHFASWTLLLLLIVQQQHCPLALSVSLCSSGPWSHFLCFSGLF